MIIIECPDCFEEVRVHTWVDPRIGVQMVRRVETPRGCTLCHQRAAELARDARNCRRCGQRVGVVDGRLIAHRRSEGARCQASRLVVEQQ
jgi:hypothetical protein